MKYSFAALAFAATGALAGYDNGTVYTTQIVTALTTYCPAATQITHNGQTYTITEATTLTITDCPCTLTKPVIKVPVTSVPAVIVPASSSTVLYTSCPSSATVSTAPVLKSLEAKSSTFYSNPLTVAYSTGAVKPTGSSPSSPAVFTGAANANKVGVMVGAVAGLAALAL